MALSVIAVSSSGFALGESEELHRHVHDIGAEPFPASSKELCVRVEARRRG